MEQSRVEELERLLAEAIPRVVISDSNNEQISLSRYRLDLAATRESYHPGCRSCYTTLNWKYKTRIYRRKL